MSEAHLHAFIGGMTSCGKTHLAKDLARQFRHRGVGVIALHKADEPWPGVCVNWQTSDVERFMAKYRQCQRVVAFMEMADAEVEKYDDRFHKCATRDRHLGNRCFFIAQRPAAVHPAIRENCEGLYLFTCGAAAKVWAAEFCDPEIIQASRLPKYNFVYKANRYAPARLMKLT